MSLLLLFSGDVANELEVRVVQRFGRSLIMPPNPALNVVVGPDVWKLAESLIRSIGLVASATESVRVAANTVSRILGNSGQVAFVAQDDHASITNYTARVRVSGNSTVVATQSLGTPTPDGNNVIIVDLTSTFSGLAAGNYTVSILATSSGGSTDSAESSPFALPLA